MTRDENTNLLDETVRSLDSHNHSPSDVLWVGTSDVWFTWDEFADPATNANYDSRYGSPKVAQDLVIVGKDWWMNRHEYDGSEWWYFNTSPIIPTEHRAPANLTVNQANLDKYSEEFPFIGWKTLKDLNGWV